MIFHYQKHSVLNYFALSACAYYLWYCLVCQCVLPWILLCLPVHIIWGIASSANVYYIVIALSANVRYLKYCLVSPVYTWCWRCMPCLYYPKYCLVCVTREPLCITQGIASSANAYYLGYCHICQRVLPGILFCLLAGVTWDIALSASVYYLGYCVVCQCLLHKVWPFLPVYVTWCLHCLLVCITQEIASSANVSDLGLHRLLVCITYRMLPCLPVCIVLPGILPCLPRCTSAWLSGNHPDCSGTGRSPDRKDPLNPT